MDQACDPHYVASGVVSSKAEAGLDRLHAWVEQTFPPNPSVRPYLPLGYFSNLSCLDGLNLGITITTDGVGTKRLVADRMEKYDPVGIDHIAMNINDLLCVGATPTSFVDYLAVETLQPDVLDALGPGPCRSAELARVNIPGGEIAQLEEMIRGIRDGSGLDLAGTAIGTVPPDRIIIGKDIQPGDTVIGLASSGIRSNGLSLARQILLKDAQLTGGVFCKSSGTRLVKNCSNQPIFMCPKLSPCLRQASI